MHKQSRVDNVSVHSPHPAETSDASYITSGVNETTLPHGVPFPHRRVIRMFLSRDGDAEDSTSSLARRSPENRSRESVWSCVPSRLRLRIAPIS